MRRLPRMRKRIAPRWGRLDFKSSEMRSTCLVGSTPTLFRQPLGGDGVKTEAPIERDVVLGVRTVLRPRR